MGWEAELTLVAMTAAAFVVGILISRYLWRRRVTRQIAQEFQHEVERAVLEELKRRGYLRPEGDEATPAEPGAQPKDPSGGNDRRS